MGLGPSYGVVFMSGDTYATRNVGICHNLYMTTMNKNIYILLFSSLRSQRSKKYRGRDREFRCRTRGVDGLVVYLFPKNLLHFTHCLITGGLCHVRRWPLSVALFFEGLEHQPTPKWMIIVNQRNHYFKGGWDKFLSCSLIRINTQRRHNKIIL